MSNFSNIFHALPWHHDLPPHRDRAPSLKSPGRVVLKHNQICVKTFSYLFHFIDLSKAVFKSTDTKIAESTNSFKFSNLNYLTEGKNLTNRGVSRTKSSCCVGRCDLIMLVSAVH